MIKTYRGLLATDGQDQIRLSTIKGKVGYRIVKFEVIDTSPLDTSARWSVKIFKSLQTAITTAIDFTDSDLIGVGIWTGQASSHNYPEDMTVIFDKEMFNQDIYITAKAESGAFVNYYLELEVIPLDDHGAEYTTLKDMRQA